jgi:hypothetical protein
MNQTPKKLASLLDKVVDVQSKQQGAAQEMEKMEDLKATGIEIGVKFNSVSSSYLFSENWLFVSHFSLRLAHAARLDAEALGRAGAPQDRQV